MKAVNEGMNRRRFLEVSGAGAAAFSLGGCAGVVRSLRERTSPEKKALPNFIIIFTDDQGYQDVGCFGSPKIKTPNLDRMAREGMKFTTFYSSASVCSPSRASLMTGTYAQRLGISGVFHPESDDGLNTDEITIADMVKTRGYATACVGKWHLGHLPQFLPTRRGFDSYFGIPYSNDMINRNPDMDPGIPLMRDEKIIELPVRQDNLTIRYTKESVRFIKKNRNQPFFLYLPHTFPHVPLFASKNFKGKSERGLYGDVIEEIDWSVGQILDTLKKLRLAENTLVVFTSDNGPWLTKGENGGCALPLRDGKFSTWEGGMRMPCIMQWTGRIPAGTICDEVAATIDIFPTIANLIDVASPHDRLIDGRDILPLMEGRPGAKTPHETYCYHRQNSLEALRAGKWKIVFNPNQRGYRKTKIPAPYPTDDPHLYDLENDISESINVAEKYPDEMKTMLELAEKARDDLGDARAGRVGKNVRQRGVSKASILRKMADPAEKERLKKRKKQREKKK